MSYQYDQYLVRHKENVKRGYDWLLENLPGLVKDIPNLGWQCMFAHDQSKSEMDEYAAYDTYFYGGNRSFAVVQEYRKAWLLHIHRNPHHWQHWVLINDDPDEGEIILEMPVNYILEMICDWWAFSWAEGNLLEIFKWYDGHKNYMKLHPKTRNMVEDILRRIKEKLEEVSYGNPYLVHHGVKGQKWGVRNGPPYPLDKSPRHDTIVKDAIESGLVSKELNPEKQMRHTKNHHTPGRSYLDGDLEYAQKLIDKLSGTGEAKLDRNGGWNHRERVTSPHDIGTYVNEDGVEIKSNIGMIIYSKTGTHIYPVRRKDDRNEN
ncbi:MAG: hypothetical protein HFH39_04215 [Lachnospiraceae bacterium]|nr:hypothetical protein [Lachnospiraceae bacterium]